MSWYRPSDIGLRTRTWLAQIGQGARLFVRLLALVVPTLRRFSLVRDQMHFLGNYSLAIIAVSGLFVGFVFGLQGYYTLQRYGSAEALGLLVTLTLVRELGPVVTALLFAGRAGTSLTAEIGLMKAGEQISVLEMMAVDPVQRILAPRFWAGVIVMPMLAAVFSAMGIIGGWVVGVLLIGVDAGSFWSQIQGGVDVWRDVGNGLIKSLVFGTTVTFIPFKGTGPALQELMAGRVDVASGIMSAALPLLEPGKVRMLAVLGRERTRQYPDIPTVAEMGVPEYDYTAWMGFLAPAATPAAIVNKLSEGFAKVVKTPEIAAQIERQSATAVGSTPAEFRQLIATEVTRWQKVVSDSGITLVQ